MLKRKKTLSKLLATTMVLTSFTVNASAAEVNTSTIGGNDRYETAIKISENGWTSSDRAVLINGEKGLVDALTATPYAYAKNAPILITAQGKLTTSTKNRLSAMNVKNVDIVGGVNSVSNQVVNELKNMGITVNRISGASRYDTSLAVAKEVDKIQDVSEIAVVNGDKGIPDAVSVAAPAASKKMPILLAENGGLNSASKDFVNGESVSKSYVIGSSNSVSDTVMNSLPGTKTRLGGADRHDTNAAVIKEFYTASSLSNVYVAKSGYVKNNDEIVDALAAGVLAAKNGNPVVLVGNSINSSQQTLLAGKKFTKLTQIGMGVPANSVNQIKATQADEESAVNSVSVVDYKTIKVTGKLLDKLSASSFSVSGNSVSSYTPNTAGTEATIAFNNAFASSNTLSVTSNLGKVTTHNFTYSTDINSVQATTKEVSTSGIQYLEITTNNSIKRTVNELKSLGWKVEFSSNEKVFYNENGDFKSTSEDGKLRLDIGSTPGEGKVFSYDVTLTKGTNSIKSESGFVKIVNKSNQYKSINSFELKELKNSMVFNSRTFVTGEKFDIQNMKLTDKNNIEDNIVSLKGSDKFTVTTSNPAVVSVDQTKANKNTLTAESKGSALIKISDGNVSNEFTVTVKDDSRTPSKATLSSSSIYISSNSDSPAKEIVKVFDQYGDPINHNFNVTEKDIITTENKKIAKLSLEDTKDGKAELVITPEDGAEGISKYTIMNGDKTWATVTINVKPITASTKTELELKDKTMDNSLDIYSENDRTLVLNANEYSGSYFYQTVSQNITFDGNISDSGYSVISSNKNIATVGVSSSDITITGVKEGTADIKLYKDKILKNTYRVIVKDSTPKVTGIELNTVDTITEANAIYDPAKSLLNLTNNIVEGVYVSGNSKNILYEKSTGSDAVLKIDDTNGRVVAKIVVEPKFKDSNADGTVNLVSGDKGDILVKFYTNYKNGQIDTTSSPYKTVVIKVDIK